MSSFVRNLQGQEYLTRLDHSDFSYRHYFRMFYNAGVLLLRCLCVSCIVIWTFTGVSVMTYYPDFHVNDEYIHLLARLKKKKKNLVLSWFKLFWFYLCWHKQCGWLEKKHWIQFELSVTNLLPFERMCVSVCVCMWAREREREYGFLKYLTWMPWKWTSPCWKGLWPYVNKISVSVRAPRKKCQVSWLFSEDCGLTSYGSGWCRDTTAVSVQCLWLEEGGC